MRNVIMLVLAVFGFTNVAMADSASDSQYVYRFDLKAPKVETYITQEVCDQVGQAAGYIRDMIDKDQSDRQIKSILYKSVMSNLNDKTGVTVYHLLLSTGFIDQVREIKTSSFYRDIHAAEKRMSVSAITDVWANATCQTQIGTTVKEIRVVRVKKGVAF